VQDASRDPRSYNDFSNSLQDASLPTRGREASSRERIIPIVVEGSSSSPRSRDSHRAGDDIPLWSEAVTGLRRGNSSSTSQNVGSNRYDRNNSTNNPVDSNNFWDNRPNTTTTNSAASNQKVTAIEWSCSFCTFVNDSASRVCAMCDKTHNASAVPSLQGRT